jgi:hypothetical protein
MESCHCTKKMIKFDIETIDFDSPTALIHFLENMFLMKPYLLTSFSLNSLRLVVEHNTDFEDGNKK